MKKGIHPEYKLIQVRCACGNSFETHATVEKINVEIYHNKRQTDISKVHKGDTVRCILELVGLRFLNQQFQCEWRLAILKIVKSQKKKFKISGYRFNDSDDEDEDDSDSDEYDYLDDSELIEIKTYQYDADKLKNG